MNNGLIITPYLNTEIRKIADIDNYDYIICADTAYIKCKKENITPNLIIGDFDHGIIDCDLGLYNNVIKVPSEKNDTDTMLCVKKMIELNIKNITIIGGIGGRCDHTYANIQTIAYCLKNGFKCTIKDDKNEMFMLGCGNHLIETDKKYISFFSYSESSVISIRNAKYSVENHELTYYFPLGVSNEKTDKPIIAEISKGIILTICSND